MEDGHLVTAARHEAEVVEVKRALRLWMDAADVEGELPVDEDPHVVVALEGEGLVASVGKGDVQFGREEVVVRRLAVVRHHLIEEEAIEREVGRRLKRRHVRERVVAQRQVGIEAAVDAGHVRKPLVQVRAVVEHELGAVAARREARGLAVGAEGGVDHAGRGMRVPGAAVEVGVRRVEVAVCERHDDVVDDGLDARRRRRGRQRRRPRWWRGRRLRGRRRWQWRRRAKALQVEGGLDAKGGRCRLPLRVEDVEHVARADGQVERIKVDGAADTRMDAAEVDDEPAVDKDPHIVVSVEAERLAATIDEVDVDLGCEEEVVHAAVVGQVELVEAEAIEREVGVGREGRDVGRRVEFECDRRIVAHVHARHVGIPRVERRRAVVDHDRGAVPSPREAAMAHGAPVRPERWLDEVGGRVPVPAPTVHVDVLAVEVAVSHLNIEGRDVVGGRADSFYNRKLPGNRCIAHAIAVSLMQSLMHCFTHIDDRVGVE